MGIRMALKARLKSSHIVQWGLAYLGGAWVAVQVVEALADPWGISASLKRGITVLLGVGFAVTLILAWFRGEKGRQRFSGLEAVLLVGALGIGGLLLSRVGDPIGDQAPGPAGLREGTVAVLPFVDMSPGGDHQYLADGVADEIIHALTRDGRVRVAARSSSFALRDQPASSVGTSLLVESVLEGSVRREGDTIRITAHLVNTRDGFQMWSREFNRRMENVLQVQAEISAAVVEELTGAAVPSAPASTLIDPEAYDLYLQARFSWNRRTERDVLRSVELFRESLELAPEYPRALAGLADSYAILGFYQYLPPGEAFPEAARLAGEALRLDPGLAEAHATLAYARLYYDWDWEGSEVAFRSSIDLNPRYAVAHQWYANLLTVLGRGEEAIRELRVATELDPLSLVARAALPWAHHYAREYERAMDLFDQARALDEDFMLTWYFQGATQEQLGDMEGAVVSLRRAVELSDSSAITVAGLARAMALAGDADAAQALLEGLMDPARTPNPPPYEIGRALLALGQPDQAIAWFERAYRERANQIVFIAVDPAIDEVRGDPRVQALLGDMGLDP
jgi:TolB-like protein/Tfp pilus assembly protein PilF